MIFKQLFEKETSTYTYLLADPITKEAVIIDPVVEMVERDLKLIDELGLNLIYTLDTHVHADHITGSGLLRDKTGAQSVVSEVANVECADIAANDGERLYFGSYNIEVRSTPGHTDGCVSYIVEDSGKTYAFTGDALFIRGTGRTDFQQGDAMTLYRSVYQKIFTLPDNTLVYPGHDYKGHTSSTVAEEKAHNPRLNTRMSEKQFVEIMDNLQLDLPRKIDVALPANQACGLPEKEEESSIKTVQEVWPSEIRTLSNYRIIDVRQPEEFHGPQGHIDGAKMVPLATVPTEAANWSPDDKILVVCRSGARSGGACNYLVQNGFQDVTNLRGGMMAWQDASSNTVAGVQR
jgi:glyoxylase-like metal-dependent hydrolase (beta-lactamase superfamily II)/rhodanese-related sulfurtransferase